MGRDRHSGLRDMTLGDSTRLIHDVQTRRSCGRRPLAGGRGAASPIRAAGPQSLTP